MSLRRQFSHPVLGDKPLLPAVITPPEETDRAPNTFWDETNEWSSVTGNNAGQKPSSALPENGSLSRIYRYTPTPTIVLDGSMSIVEISDSHPALSEKSRDSLLGARISDLEPDAIPVPNVPTLYGALRAAFTTRRAQEVSNIPLNGNISRLLRVTPIFEESKLLYVVLETHKAIKETVDGEHAYIDETYKILVDTVKEYAIYMLDPHGRIATWNPGAAILKGYSAEEIVGKHFSVFYGEEDRRNGKPAKGLAVCLREGRMEDEGWRYRRDGSRFWADVMITPIYQFGQHVGFVKVTRDLTERKQAEARMISAYEESSKLKTDFLANISHEIRTPMNGMHLALTMLTQTGLNPQQHEYTSIIQDSTSVLLQIVNDVLDYSKLSSGSFSLHSDVVEVEGLVSAVVRNCRPSLQPGVKLSNTIAPNFPKALLGDPLRYRQVLQNLIGNAVKFTEDGYVRVSTFCAVDEEDPGCCTVTTRVVDSGIGVPDSAINTLFTPFSRLANYTTRKFQGTGLGLSICKSLSELMGGTVGFSHNVEGRGSTFWFTSKMNLPSLNSSPSIPHSPEHETGMSISEKVREIAPHKHLLLVEDNIINHTVMLKLLQGLGFERVDGAWNGEEAVRMVKQKPLSYDIILMDVNMPVMDGMAATTQIRDLNVDVPIIAITGNALKGDAEAYLAKGMNDCIGKPVIRERLLETLWRWMGT